MCELCLGEEFTHALSRYIPPVDIFASQSTITRLQKKLSEQFAEEFPPVLREKCEICLSEIQNSWNLSSCPSHKFCRDCIITYLQVLITESKVKKITCPGDSCSNTIEDFNIEKLVGQPLYAKYLYYKERAELMQDPKVKWCIKPDCQGYIRISPFKTYMSCPICSLEICCKCGKQWHSRMSCDEVVDRDYEEWARGKEIQLCPKCKHKIEKASGCNHMTCSSCQYQWCWICRSKYSNKHFESWNPFGCPKLQAGSNTRTDWTMRRVYWLRFKLWALWIIAVVCLPILLVFGPAGIFIIHDWGRRKAWKNILYFWLIFIGTPLLYLVVIVLLIIKLCKWVFA